MELEESMNKCKKFCTYENGLILMEKEVLWNYQEAVETVLEALEDSIPRKKIEDKIKSLDSNNKDERMIKFYTLDKKYYYQTDKYNKIIKQILQELLEEK